jgi:hypothetical protein
MPDETVTVRRTDLGVLLAATPEDALGDEPAVLEVWKRLAKLVADGDPAVPFADATILELGTAGLAGAATPELSLPEGIFGRVELPGRREHTGWVTEETRFGAQVAVIRDWDGNVKAEVFGGPGCQFVHLPTPLRRPEPARALGVAVDGWDSAEDSAYGEDDEVNPF